MLKYMNRRLVFVDTSGFISVIFPKDERHSLAVKLWSQMIHKTHQLVTSNFVLDETYTLLRNRMGVQTVVKFREMFTNEPHLCQVIAVTALDEAQSWQWFVRDVSKLSYTDATSFAVMKRMAVDTVFGFDHHFLQAGFSQYNGEE